MKDRAGEAIPGMPAAEERKIDDAIAAHGGDARATVGSLLAQREYLEAARDRALALVSLGFTRGRLIEVRGTRVAKE